MNATPIAFTVIGGFLGAGKTTVVNDLLRQATAERIMVLVNDFGDVAIDADLIAAHDGDTITLTNGCLCCSLGGEFIETIPRLLGLVPRPERVLVEASGISEPRKIAQYGTLPGFRLDGVVVLADAEQIRTQAADPRVGPQVRGQLGQADILVVTKTDLVDANMLSAIRAWLAEDFPGARVVESVQGHVAAELLLGSGSSDLGPAGGAGLGEGGPGSHELEHAFESMTLVADPLVHRVALEGFLASLPPGAIRVKGLVRLADDPARITVVQRVGARLRLSAGASWPDEDEVSRLVVITTAGGLAGIEVADPWRR